VLDIVANTVRERAYVQRQVRVLSAEGRLSIAILSALPFGIFLYLALMNPSTSPAVHDHAGSPLVAHRRTLMGWASS
jgi:tight adherence protein B